MPYIKPETRSKVESQGALGSGELKYQVTRVIEKYRATHDDSYQTFNDIIGALEGAKLEFSRRVVAPYEDRKRRENGDVYAAPKQ